MKVGAGSFADIVKGSNPKRSIVVCDPPPPMVISIDNSDLLKLDEFGSAILVKVRDINLMENLYFILHREGFPTVNLRYVGGLWNDFEEPMALGRVCILTKILSKIGTLGKVKCDEAIFDVSINEVSIWTPSFKKPCQGGDSSSDDSDEDKISVADSFENMEVNPVEYVAESDPFNLEGVIKGVGREESKASSSPSRPPGYAALKENGCPFTEAYKGPCVQHSTGHEEVVVKEPFKGLNTEGGDLSQLGESIQSVSSGCSKKEGGSLFNELQRHIQLGQAMGFHMKGSKSDLKKVIMGMSEKFVDQ
ncbi:hypothetical protein L1987_34318 [Smallanthus sonchifolius]|uniref:Uncharacterized protein n=1 Tax=Smallanthus sonchifolius TaxID=185202 RepID=A0ACB9HUW7_9ASTR|nr:hypothetical protein L1987_34318 [Smallanthus sonchifolius]